METCPRHHISFAAGSYCPGCIATIALGEEEEQPDPIASLGSYEIIRELGRGGMGVVYMARQAGLNRKVALKLLLSGSLAGEEFVQRFRREGELAASLQHPNIVRIFEAGEAEGELFYSMELITGGSLADWKDGKTPLPMDAAKIMRTLTAAVAHAHARGILHRDLKPSNILIDEDGSPKVADFGLAHPLESPHDLTLGTHAFGSPAYLAPELVRDPRDATPASDIYSLGAILYFLLSGRSPFVSASLDELLRQVRECEPAPPRVLDPSIPLDLQKICLKALDKIPARRYASAAEFGEDLQRFIEGRPVIARPAGPLLKAARLAKRSPWLTAALVSLFLALTGGIAGTAWQAKIANARADESNRHAAELRLNLYASDIAAASTALGRGDLPLANELLSHWDKPGNDDLRGFEWRLLKHLSRPTANRYLGLREATITAIAPSADGQLLAVADQRGVVKIRPLPEGKHVSLNLPQGEDLAAISTDLGSGWVLAGKDGVIRWLNASEKIIREAPGRQVSLATQVPIAIVASVPRYHWWGKPGSAYLIDWKSGTRIRDIPGGWRHTAISADGTKVALAGLSGRLILMDVATGATRDLPTSAPVWALSFSPDGKRLAAGGNRSATIWDLDAGSTLPIVLPHQLNIWMTAFSLDGTHFLTASSDRRVRVWNTADFSASPVTLTGHQSEVWCAAFSPDGKTVFGGGKGGDLLAWDITQSEAARDFYLHDQPFVPSFSPDGRYLLTNHGDHGHLHDLTEHDRQPMRKGLLALGISPDGTTLRLADWSGRTASAPVADPQQITFHERVALPAPVHHSLAIADGRWIVRVLDNGSVVVLDPANGRIAHQLKGPRPGMRHTVEGSADGQLIAIGGDGSREMTLHDLRTGKARTLAPASSYYYVASAFSRDGKYLAAGDLSGPIQIWNVSDGSLVVTLPGHPEETSAVAFSPDGRTLASMGFHQDLKLWHAATWREVHSANIADAGFHLRFSPNGDGLLFTTGRTGNERAEWLPAPWPQQ